MDTVSHELRTPLTLVHGYAELLTRETGRHYTAAQIRDMLREVHRGSSTMLRLVDDLLDFGRVEGGRLRLRLAEADLALVVRAATGGFAHSPGGGRLRLDLPAEPLLARVDADRVGQIVANLVANALQYAPDGPVRVGLREAPAGTAVLEVADVGPGLTPEALPRVWERFFRGSAAGGSPVRGAGIGLALVKQLAEAHGGVAEAESTLGQGATFRVRLPLQPA